jgi:hypothetical protein
MPRLYVAPDPDRGLLTFQAGLKSTPVPAGINEVVFSTEFKSFQHLRNGAGRDRIHLVVTKFASNRVALSTGANELRSPTECAKLRSVE